MGAPGFGALGLPAHGIAPDRLVPMSKGLAAGGLMEVRADLRWGRTGCGIFAR